MNCSTHDQPFMNLADACKVTGLSTYYLRQGCKAGTVPHIRNGVKYMVNIPELRRKLDEESRRGAAL